MSEHTYKGCTITIHQDDDAESPREYDNLGTMVCCHGRYNLGDRSVQPEDINPTLAEFGDDMISLPLYLYDHSGITMNTTGRNAAVVTSGMVDAFVLAANVWLQNMVKTTLFSRLNQYFVVKSKNTTNTYAVKFTGTRYSLPMMLIQIHVGDLSDMITAWKQQGTRLIVK